MKNLNFKLLVVLAGFTLVNACSKRSDPVINPVVPTPTPTSQVKCYNATPTTLTRKNSAMLCSSSPGADTVANCYYSTPVSITDAQASLVCAGNARVDAAPVSCILDSTISSLDNFNAAVLCSNSDNQVGPPDCYNASSLSLLNNEAAVLCQGSYAGAASDSANQCYLSTPLTLPEPDAATLCSRSHDNGVAANTCYGLTPVSLPESDAAILCQGSNNGSNTLSCYINSPSSLTDAEAAILCAGADTGGIDSAPAKCYRNSNLELTNYQAALLCSGAKSGRDQEPNNCYKTTSVNLSEGDAAILCSANTPLLTSMYSVNTQYNLRTAHPKPAIIDGNIESRDISLVKLHQVMSSGRKTGPSANRGGVARKNDAVEAAKLAVTKKSDAAHLRRGNRPASADVQRSSNLARRTVANPTTNTLGQVKPKN